MSGIAEFELALAVLEVSITAAKEINQFLNSYRDALKNLSIIKTSLSLASCKAEQFYAALVGHRIPSRYHVPITQAVELLNPKLDDVAALLKHYHHADGELRAIDKAHWAAFGERRAKRIKVDIDTWSRDVFELVVVTLLTGSDQASTRDSGQISVIVQRPDSLKRLPGFEATVSMKEAVAAVDLSDKSDSKSPISQDKILEIACPVLTPKHTYDDETSLEIVGTRKRVLLQHMYIPMDGDSSINAFKVHKNTHNLAQILGHSDPARSYVPTCTAYFRDENKNRYSLVFPDTVNIDDIQYLVSAHSLLSAIQLVNRNTASDYHERAITGALTDLESRSRIAIRLIHALSYIHAIGWVHKGFQSSKILLSVAKNSNVVPLVLGFHRSRPTDLKVVTGGEPYRDWKDIVYRHPDRWQSAGNPTFRRRYDVYSLGVVLLELGTGRPAYEIAVEPFHNVRDIVAAKSSSERAQIIDRRGDEVIETFITEARNLKKKQGKAYSENLEACFVQTRVRHVPSSGIVVDDDEADADLCRNLLSKWVTDLSATRF